MVQKDLLKLSKDYKSGLISEDVIKEIERVNNQTIDELVSEIDKLFEYKKHCVKTMTTTDLRKWLKKKKITDEEKKLYADANKCTYEQALDEGRKRLQEFDAMQDFKQMDSLYAITDKERDMRIKGQQEYLERGLIEVAPDGQSWVSTGEKSVDFLRHVMRGYYTEKD